MDIEKKIGSEITVRISLTFQDAPDVHTLLAMTPVRQRGKLVRLALERYIVETGHTAGNVEAQIEAISDWLRNRNTASIALDCSPKISSCMKSDVTADVQDDRSSNPPPAVAAHTIPLKTPSVEPIVTHIQDVSGGSQSMMRWLKS